MISYRHKLLERQIVSRVEFKNEDVVDAVVSPAPHVDADAEDEEEEGENTAKETQRHEPVGSLRRVPGPRN